MPGWAWERLAAELPADPKALVFPNRKGTEMTNHQYRYEFDKAVAAMQARDRRPAGTRDSGDG